jgi:hypothetical protein
MKSFHESQHPREATGIFKRREFTTPDIALRAGLSAEDRITHKIITGNPGALSWSTAATPCHGGHEFLGPIYVEFEFGTVTLEPHPLEDHVYLDALADLTREWAPEEIRVDLTSGPAVALRPDTPEYRLTPLAA